MFTDNSAVTFFGSIPCPVTVIVTSKWIGYVKIEFGMNTQCNLT